MTSYIRFVSFLLSLAHRRSNEINSTSVDELLFQQIEKLAKQIIKPKDEGEKKEKKEGEAAEADEPDSCWSPPEPAERDTSQVGPTF